MSKYLVFGIKIPKLVSEQLKKEDDFFKLLRDQSERTNEYIDLFNGLDSSIMGILVKELNEGEIFEIDAEFLNQWNSEEERDCVSMLNKIVGNVLSAWQIVASGVHSDYMKNNPDSTDFEETFKDLGIPESLVFSYYFIV